MFQDSAKLREDEIIKNQDILSTISEISETLSLTNNPKQILEMALDTLSESEVLDIDCCWVQLVTLGSNKLPLAACRGFSPNMEREMALMDLAHFFNNEVAGLGKKIIIPNLNRDGKYDIPVFEKAGFCSLIAVPIRTYRVIGVMGVAYRVKKKFNNGFPELLTVIASLIGMALNKSTLNKQDTTEEKQLGMSNTFRLRSDVNGGDINSVSVEAKERVNNTLRHQNEKKENSVDFQDHALRMIVFSRSHIK